MAVYAEDSPEDPAPLLKLGPASRGEEGRDGLAGSAVEAVEPHHLD